MLIDRADVAAALPRYELGTELGRGAFGLVWSARHRQLGRTDAIKILSYSPGGYGDLGGADRFVEEARVLAALDHPHVVRVFDYVEHGSLQLIVMEYLPGGTLRADAENGVSVERACAIGLSVAEALSHAHENGILHRDIKPDNMLLAADGLLKVNDFGIAKMFEGSATTASAVIGTPRYMAPEQIRGGQISPATDLYALGAVLYELLAGAPLFGRIPGTALMHHHLTVTPEPLYDVPAPIADVIMQMLLKKPHDRPASAHGFALDLAAAASDALGTNWLSRTAMPLRPSDDVREAARKAERKSEDEPRSAIAHLLTDETTERRKSPDPYPSKPVATPVVEIAMSTLATADSLVKAREARSSSWARPGRLVLIVVAVAIAIAVATAFAVMLALTPSARDTTSVTSRPLTDSAQYGGAARTADEKFTSNSEPVLTPDGETLAITGDEISMKRLSNKSLSASLVTTEAGNFIYHASFSADGHTVVGTTYNGIRVWDVPTDTRSRNAVPTVRPTGAFANAAEENNAAGAVWATNSGAFVVTRGWVFDATTRKKLVNLHPGGPNVAFSHDGRAAAVISADQRMTIWNARTWERTSTSAVLPRSHCASYAWNPQDSKILVLCNPDRKDLYTLGEMDAVTMTFKTLFTLQSMRDVAISADGNRVATALTVKGNIQLTVWDVASRKAISLLDAGPTQASLPPTDEWNPSSGIEPFTPVLDRGGRVISTSDGGTTMIWRL